MSRVTFICAIAALVAAKGQAAPPSTFITGGILAAAGEIPYQVSLRYYGQHICGGALIGNQHVLTAAHCFTGMNPTAGTFKVFSSSHTLAGGKAHDVLKITLHPRYNPSRTTLLYNDIAVIKLTQPVAYNNNCKPIALPTKDTVSRSGGMVTGFGRLSAKTGVSRNLLKLNVNILTYGDCSRLVPKQYTLHTNQICGYTNGNRGQGTCQGDSGGPLVFGGQVVGVVSGGFGDECGNGHVDIYTKVWDHIDFVRNTLKA